jgi:hypothetical protein
MSDFKERCLATLAGLVAGVEQGDIPAIIKGITDLRIDPGRGGALIYHTEEAIISDLTEEVRKREDVRLRVSRPGRYREPVVDVYTLNESGELMRNQAPAKFTGLGTLYAAYKYIHEIT